MQFEVLLAGSPAPATAATTSKLQPHVSGLSCLAAAAAAAVYMCSPFFSAFQNGLVQDQQIAEAIFAFTDAIPGADIGTAVQTVSLLSNSLISEVDMTVFPGFTGTVITSSRLQVGSQGRWRLEGNCRELGALLFVCIGGGGSLRSNSMMLGTILVIFRGLTSAAIT
jgi:hypothetical protein